MTSTLPQRTRLERVAELQSRIHGMQATKLEGRALPTHPAFNALLPGGTVREGTVTEVRGSGSLLMALLAEASAAGRWCAVVGIPEFGIEAAERFGLDLDRLALVPRPGRHWFTVVATLAEAIPLVAVRPGGRVQPAEASRLAARLRERGSALLVDGDWPGSEVSLGVESSGWSGLERGHGLLADHELLVRASGRGGFASGRRARLRLAEGARGFVAAPPLAAVRPSAGERRAG
ncbi:hypothetical protein ROT00_06725 [Agromyces mediolanus]|uniref:hypothetical protein n=1 Tax=Agromyces mediolanus TaxID=41986 RepID=UPI003832DED8